MAYLYDNNTADNSGPYSASPSEDFGVSMLLSEPSATLLNYWPLVGLRATDDWMPVAPTDPRIWVANGQTYNNTVLFGASEMPYTLPSSVPSNCWEHATDGAQEYAHTTHQYQPSTGPARTPAHKHRRDGPSTPPSAPQKTRAPRGSGKPRNCRLKLQECSQRLRCWAQHRDNLADPPSFNQALAVAVEVIPTIRAQASLEPCLRSGNVRRTREGSKNADVEHGRRRVERELLEELSRYYPVEMSEGKSWGRPLLLMNVLRDLEDLTEPPDPKDLETTGA